MIDSRRRTLILEDTMLKIIDGKRYNSDTGKSIAEIRHYNNGNYSGTTTLMVSPNGNLYKWTDSNGQDCYLSDDIWTGDIDIDGYEIIDEELAKRYRLVQ